MTTKDISAAAAVLGRTGGSQTSPAKRAASRANGGRRWAGVPRRPVVAVRHARDGSQLSDWPVIGSAHSITGAVILARQAGYRVGGTPQHHRGYCWDMVPAEVAGTDVDAFGVPVICAE